MAWVRVIHPSGEARKTFGEVIENVRTLVDYTKDEGSVNRYAYLLQVYDYTNGSTDTITIDPSDASSTTWVEGSDFNATTSNSQTAENIASAINGTADYSAQAVTGHAYDPYVSIEYIGGGGYINSASSNDTTAWEMQTVNTTNGTIAKIASDNTGTRKNQPVFTDSKGFFEFYLDNRGNFDLLFNKSGATFDNSHYENITPAGVPGLAYDSANNEIDLTKVLNANGNIITEYVGLNEMKRPNCGVV